MSTSPGLAFANLTLLLDVPQLPAIFAVKVKKEMDSFCKEMKRLSCGSPNGVDIIYPHNRLNPQNQEVNTMGRRRKYNNGPWMFGLSH